jgi:hypothetical protein
VVAVSPADYSWTATDHVDITFNLPIDPSSFTVDDVTLNGPDGPITPTAVTPLSDLEFEVDFPSQAVLGTYRVTVGPGIEDNLGWAKDQNQNGVAGEVPNDQFTASFKLIATPPLYIDDGDAGFTTVGGWSSWPLGWQGEMEFKQAGSGAAAATFEQRLRCRRF